MKTVNKVLLLLLAIFSVSANANWVGRWESKGNDVVIGLSSDPNNPHSAKNSLLVIGYSKNNNCNPVVSVLVMKGQSIGTPISQKTFKSKKNQLILRVGSQEFTTETKLTEYTNAVEFAMMGNQSIVNALSKQNTSFSAKIGNTSLLDFKSASNFSIANQIARQNCR